MFTVFTQRCTFRIPECGSNAGDPGSIPGSGRLSGGGNGNPLQYSCLENPMDRGAWWVIVHGVTKSQTWLSESHTHTHTFEETDQERTKCVELK